MANAAGTASGVVITAEGYENYVDYTDIAGNAKATVYGPTLEATVLAIYGLNKAGPGAPVNQTTDPSVAVYYAYSITNAGNTTDSYALSSSIRYTGSYGAAWTVLFYLDADNNGVPDGGAISSISLAEDAATYFLLKVVPSATAGAVASGTVTITAETSGSPSGEYTGANGNIYGGPGFVNDETTTEVQAPTLVMTRTATADSPNDYRQTGDTVNWIPVPGSVVTITMTYSNEGTATAESSIIIDKVPAGHYAGHVNCPPGGGNIIHMILSALVQGTATGWTVSYTSEATLSSGQKLYGNTTGWVQLGTIESAANYWLSFPQSGPTDLSFEATYIKWEKATIEATEDGQTLTWGYIIR
jgi:hypothetical protein